MGRFARCRERAGCVYTAYVRSQSGISGWYALFFSHCVLHGRYRQKRKAPVSQNMRASRWRRPRKQLKGMKKYEKAQRKAAKREAQKTNRPAYSIKSFPPVRLLRKKYAEPPITIEKNATTTARIPIGPASMCAPGTPRNCLDHTGANPSEE